MLRIPRAALNTLMEAMVVAASKVVTEDGLRVTDSARVREHADRLELLAKQAVSHLIGPPWEHIEAQDVKHIGGFSSFDPRLSDG